MINIILFLLIITFFFVVIVGASITAKWSMITILFLSIAVALLTFGLWFWGNKQKLYTKQSMKLISATTFILIIISLINFFAIRYDRHWDFTENKIHTLSPLSKAIIEKLELPLEVLIFDRDIDPNLERLLKKYQRTSPQFQFRFINPEHKSGLELARQYEVQSLGEIYLQYGEKRQKLNDQNDEAGKAITETLLTNSIEQIKRERTINIYLLQRHGEASDRLVERGLAQIVSSLKEKGNNVLELNLANSGKIPDRANLIIIVGATRKLLAAEVSSLQSYLSFGGNLLLLLSPNTDIGITPLLQEWGVELDNRLIVDGSGSGKIMGFGPGVAIINNYGNHPITASLGKGISVFPESRPLKTKEQAGIKHTPLAITNEQTWAESDLKNSEIAFDINKDLSGSLNIAIALEREQSKSRMVVFGSSTFATNGWFEQQLNSDIIINSIDWLTGKYKENSTIRPHGYTKRRINLTSVQMRIIDWLALRIIPVSSLIAATFFWYKHR